MGVPSTYARGTVLPSGGRIAPHSQRRNLYAENSQTSSAVRTTYEPLTTQQLTKEVQAIVLAFPTRDVVEDTQGSQRAIENVRNGESGMSLKAFANLLRANPRARALAAPLLGYGCETDPNVVQAISVLMNQLVRSEMPGLSEPAPMHGDLFEPSRGGYGRD